MNSLRQDVEISWADQARGLLLAAENRIFAPAPAGSGPTTAAQIPCLS